MPAKPFLHPLKTPKTATFPSELHDDNNIAKTPSTTSDTTIKHEPGTATPITPPTAYTEFLKAMTPVFTSPVSAGTSFPRFQFDKPTGPAGQGQAPTSAPTPTSTTNSQPTSAVSGTFGFHEREPFVKSATLPPPPATATGTGPTSSGPGAIRKNQSLRRLRIPPSMHLSPVTTTASDAPQSATTLRSPFSPVDWKLRYMEPRSATTATSSAGAGRSVSVRQVVTRTVTYKRMQLEAPPKGKGKRRRYHEGEDV